MKLTVQLGDDEFRLVDDQGNEGSLALYDEVATLINDEGTYRATIGDPDDESSIKLVRELDGGGTETVEFITEECDFEEEPDEEDEGESEEDDFEGEDEEDEEDEEDDNEEEDES